MWKSLNHKLRMARQLSLADWITLAEAWWALLGYSVALRWMSFEELTAIPAGPAPDETAALTAKLASAQRTGRLLGLASRLHFLPMTCLVRSLALHRILIRRGIPARLRIGAGKSLNGIHAHAWVAVQGQAIGESEGIPDRFSVLESVM